tara:strand:+ start:1410 stop:1664 length:255 start_codon:yes stop_codon:yes gene_type:complete
MYLESEKVLLRKNFRGYHNEFNTTYVSNLIPTDQIVFTKGKNMYEQDGWSVSFPLKSSKMNYAVHFKNKKDAQDYLKTIINTYI